MIKVGVIGVGFMGEKHVKIFHDLPNVELRAVCDSNENRAHQVGEIYHAKPYKNYLKMFQNEDLDAISIAVPTQLHTEIILNSLDHVKNILVEKPIALSFDEAKRAVDCADNKGVNLMVGHIERFNPIVHKMQKMIVHEEIEGPVVALARRIGPRSLRILDQGVVLGLAIHDIDILRYVLSCEIKQVYAKTLTVFSAFEDYAVLVLEFEGRRLCTIEASQLSPHKARTLDVSFQKTHIRLDLLKQTMHVYRQHEDKVVRKEVHVKKEEPLRIELQHFINVALGKDKPLVTAKEGLRNLSAALAALEAAKIGRPVKPF